METENKSQLAKDLSRALALCQLRDDLADVLEMGEIQDDKQTSKETRDLIKESYRKAVVLLTGAIPYRK